MARSPRIKSSTGIYHVMIRGINQQQLFEDDEDNEYFLGVLGICKELSEYELYAYCLMSNHAHLLLKTGKEDLDLVFKRIGIRYAYWHNTKYKRVGHLFQDRFRSEPIEDDRYLLAVLRYIHRNPIKAKICAAPGDYKWSSYCEYTGSPNITDTDFIVNMIGMDEFYKFNSTEEDEPCLEYSDSSFCLSDAEVKGIMRYSVKCDTIEAFQKLTPSQKAASIVLLKGKGASIRQISRLTGVSKGIVERA